MTNEMLEDLILSLKRKIKILTAISIVLLIFCVALVVFLVCSYEVDYEYTEETTYTVDQSAETGSNSIEVTDTNDTYVICGTVIVCVALCTVGAVLYGKSKNYGNKESHKEINDTQKKA